MFDLFTFPTWMHSLKGSSPTTTSAMCIVGSKRWTGRAPFRSRHLYAVVSSILMTCSLLSKSKSRASSVTMAIAQMSFCVCFPLRCGCATLGKHQAHVSHVFTPHIRSRPSNHLTLHTDAFCVTISSSLLHAFFLRGRIPHSRIVSFDTTRAMIPPWSTTLCASSSARRTTFRTSGMVYDGLNVHTRVQKGKVQMQLEPHALDPRAGNGAKLKRGGVVNP